MMVTRQQRFLRFAIMPICQVIKTSLISPLDSDIWLSFVKYRLFVDPLYIDDRRDWEHIEKENINCEEFRVEFAALVKEQRASLIGHQVKVDVFLIIIWYSNGAAFQT